ncbi:MAG: MogA/MoaB family molybdenum cofactor biosynthesis protein [Chloroflexota bacterium]
MNLRIAVLTISDRSSQGLRPDASGPALVEAVAAQGWDIARVDIVPDDSLIIQKTLIDWADSAQADIILTTGGTGFAPRDITPEATLAVVERLTPGLAEAMRAASMAITPHAMLSRAVAGIRGGTIIVNLPGSPKAALENLGCIIGVLPHAVQLLRQSPDSESGHTYK